MFKIFKHTNLKKKNIHKWKKLMFLINSLQIEKENKKVLKKNLTIKKNFINELQLNKIKKK